MKSLVCLFFVLWFSGALSAQNQRYWLSVDSSDSELLLESVTNSGISVTILRELDFPDLGLNALVIEIDATQADAMGLVVRTAFAGITPLLVVDAFCKPDEGSGDPEGAPIEPDPSPVNLALEWLLSSPEVPLEPVIPGDVLINIVGTGVDYGHPDLAGVTFSPALSVIPADSGPGMLPGDVDLHNHETRLASCIGGTSNGLLPLIGGIAQPRYRSVMCYEKPDISGKSEAYASDCVFAIAQVLTERDARVAQPYLKNHAAVMCFSHSVETLGTRVGDLEAVLDEAWESGIVTVISAGNRNSPAAMNSPSGAGEWVVFTEDEIIKNMRYWPPVTLGTYTLPGVAGFNGTLAGGKYHIKAGAHDVMPDPELWKVNSSLGSNFNDLNPDGHGPLANDGVDLFAPGEGVPCAATRLSLPASPGGITQVVDGVTYERERGYQIGNGTSYSAAYASAVAARILTLYPWASPDQVKALMESVRLDSGSDPSFDLMQVPQNSELTGIYLTYSEWIQRYVAIASPVFFASGLDGKYEDPDDDGICNIMEYVCGMDPRHKDAALAPVVVFNEIADRIDISLHEAAYLPPDSLIDWRIERATNLSDWLPVGQGTKTSLAPLPESGDGLPVASEYAVTYVEDKQFYRVAIHEEAP